MGKLCAMIVTVALLGLMGAAPATRPSAESLEQQVTRLKLRVATLDQLNRSLEQQLRAARDRAHVEVIPPLVRPEAPWFYQPGPGMPADAVPKGEGNVRHYVIPVEVTPGTASR